MTYYYLWAISQIRRGFSNGELAVNPEYYADFYNSYSIAMGRGDEDAALMDEAVLLRVEKNPFECPVEESGILTEAQRFISMESKVRLNESNNSFEVRDGDGYLIATISHGFHCDSHTWIPFVRNADFWS